MLVYPRAIVISKFVALTHVRCKPPAALGSLFWPVKGAVTIYDLIDLPERCGDAWTHRMGRTHTILPLISLTNCFGSNFRPFFDLPVFSIPKLGRCQTLLWGWAIHPCGSNHASKVFFLRYKQPAQTKAATSLHVIASQASSNKPFGKHSKWTSAHQKKTSTPKVPTK